MEIESSHEADICFQNQKMNRIKRPDYQQEIVQDKSNYLDNINNQRVSYNPQYKDPQVWDPPSRPVSKKPVNKTTKKNEENVK